MSKVDGPLRRLATLAGIGMAYRDAWGAPREVAPDALCAVLAAMGIAAGSTAEIGDAIAALEAEEWERLLPPAAVVLEQAGAVCVPLTVPDRMADGAAAWSVATEDGTRYDGTADLAALEVLAQYGEGGGRRRRLALPVAAALPLGYHRLAVAVSGGAAETMLAVAPACAYLPPERGDRQHAWGLTTQLYALRSGGNWGMGDFGDLAALAALAAARGARLLGINPLHALFPAAPRHASPYSPSSRQFLNPLYIDVPAVPDFADCAAAAERIAAPDFAAMLARARADPLVDYEAVAGLKQPVLAMLHRAFAARHLGAAPDAARSARGAEFRRFQQEGGEPLQAFATFNALQARLLRESGAFGWRQWPGELRDPHSAAVRGFAAAHRAEIECHQYLQWEAERQLGAAAARARKAGLGLYLDLAVGVDPNGAEAWADQAMLAPEASVGAPPDPLNMKGQDWGLAPIHPQALRRAGYAPFIAALRANMRHAGALRIDHVMALRQLYWVPRGADATGGAYVSYPFEDLRRILALESRRNRCAVVGEDLGTVPPGFRETMQGTGVLSYRVLLFEHENDGEFRRPAAYPALAAASFATHDIATFEGFWLGRDLEWRCALDLYPSAAAREQDAETRRRDRHRLLAALLREGLIDEPTARDLLPADTQPVYAPALAAAVHRYLGRAASRLALVQIEDATGELEQANLPGTVNGHPNWRRKLSVALEALSRHSLFDRVTAAIAMGRREAKGEP